MSPETLWLVFKKRAAGECAGAQESGPVQGGQEGRAGMALACPLQGRTPDQQSW